MMAHPELFSLAQDDRQACEAAQQLFERVSQKLQTILPTTVEVLHIGATAIPGCLTKGDLDIVVRAERKSFQVAEAGLAALFARNPDSIRTEDFAAFEDDATTPHLGIQLTAKGGTFDIFHRFAEALRADPDLLRRYNTLKLAHNGQPMDRYRAAKDIFVTDVLRFASAERDGPTR